MNISLFLSAAESFEFFITKYIIMQLLWSYKMNMTVSGRVEKVVQDFCASELSRVEIPCKSSSVAGHALTCLTEHLNDLQVTLLLI
jgi:hypothetical protein